LQINAINAATEAACLILSVDETIKNPKVGLFLSFYELRIFAYFLTYLLEMVYLALRMEIEKK